jgi:putative membrane protein
MVIDTIDIHSDASILLLGFVLLLVNMIIKPILLILTFPLNMITFGLFTLVVNTWTILFADFLVPSIELNGFLNAFIAGVFILLLNHSLLKPQKKTSQP